MEPLAGTPLHAQHFLGTRETYEGTSRSVKSLFIDSRRLWGNRKDAGKDRTEAGGGEEKQAENPCKWGKRGWGYREDAGGQVGGCSVDGGGDLCLLAYVSGKIHKPDGKHDEKDSKQKGCLAITRQGETAAQSGPQFPHRYNVGMGPAQGVSVSSGELLEATWGQSRSVPGSPFIYLIMIIKSCLLIESLTHGWASLVLIRKGSGYTPGDPRPHKDKHRCRA